MKRKNSKFRRWTSTSMAALLLISTFLPNGFTSKAYADQADHVVISQIFGAGGNGTGSQSSPFAPYKNDFIELYNPTNAPVDLTNWSVQYTSSGGTTWSSTPLSGSIPAHGYYLIQEASGGTAGVNLPVTADATGTINMSGTAGKVALFNKTTLATVAKPTDAIDFVGFGSATSYEGTAAAKAPSNTTSVQRRPYAAIDPQPGKGNAWDTDDNLADFYAGAITTVRNTSSAPETPMAPVLSLQPKGLNIQFTQSPTQVTVTGLAGAAEPNSIINIYETASKGTVLQTGTAADNGSFTLSFTPSKTYTSLAIAATQTGLPESAAIAVDVAKASTSIVDTKLSYAVINGQGYLTGNAGSAVANSTINVYPNATATPSEKLKTLKSGTAGDFSTTFANGPDTVYVTQITSSAKGIMLESAPVAVTKADLSVVSKISDVRTNDNNGQPVNLNKYFTIKGVANVDNQILGTQKQNFFMEDGTAGINIFSTSLVTPFNVLKGDELKITGKVITYSGLTEFEAVSIEKLSEGNPVPNPTNVTILDLTDYTKAEPLEGKLVTATGKVTASAASGANFNVTFADANSKTVTVRVMSPTGIVPDTDLQTGKSYTVTGILGQFTSNVSAKTGYQIFPRDISDIAPILNITHTPLTTVYKDVSVEFAANADGAESVVTYYRATGNTDYTALQMVKGSEGRYSVTLPAADVPQAGFDYYIEAKAGIQVQSAGTADVPNHVTLEEDDDDPIINGEKPENDTRVESPHPEITALINDPSGIKEGSVHFWLDGQELSSPAATISTTQVKYTPEEELGLGVHTVKVTATDSKNNEAVKEWTFEIVPRFTGGNHYRGTTHNHTSISHDGAGSPEEALKAGKFHHYDWFAFSDHSHDIDPEKLGTDTVMHNGMPERTGGDQWQLTKNLATQYTKNGDYVVFPAFEMTATTWGHSNIFGSDNFIDRNINGKLYQDLNQYYAWVMTYDDIVGQFNHPDMGANAFNNFKPYDSRVDKIFSMLEVGNGSGHYGYANAEGKFYSALDLGWHVAPTYGEDNHEGTWGQINARTVIVADDLSQASLLHSMRNMRVYMEEDPNFTLDVLANGYYMGSTVDSKKLNFKITGSDLVAEAHNSSDYEYLPTSYKSDDRVAKVELISNGGKVVDSITPMEKDFTWNPTYSVTGGQQWFVVKVTQMDGERIYSSPIWSKEESVDVKVNSIDIDGGVVVGGNPATLKATVANNGTETVKNLKVDFYYDEVNQAHFIGTNNISSILTKSSATASATWASPITGDHQLIVVVTSNDGLDLGDVKYSLPVKIKQPLGIKVLIDASHGNENTSMDSGTYKNNLKSFTLMLQKEGYTVTENKAELTDAVLSDANVLVLTNARIALTDAENTAVANFVKNGGSLLMAGKSNNSSDPTINNGLLSEMGSAIRMGNDGVFDLSKTGNFWGDPAISPYAVRVHPGLVSNHITDRVSFVDYYSGGSLSGANNQRLTETGKVVILAKGNETTYQGNIQGGYTYDSVSDASGGSAIPLIASEEIGTKGRIVVSGMNIFNDKQMDESYEPKGNDEFSFNVVNWLAHREMNVANIADVRHLADDTDVVVEGTVTTPAGNFFDAFYVQDATGGIMAYLEVPDGSLKLGDKVRVYGHIKTFENNKELEFTSFAKDVIKLGSGAPVQPKQVSTGEATSSTNQGLLVKVIGKVVSKFDDNSYFINDGTGKVLVFTDGYIINQGVPLPDIKVGDTLEAVGLSGAFAQGERIRVRNTEEVIRTIDTIAPDTPVVNDVTDKHLVITGTAEAGVQVVAKVGGVSIGEATVNENGIFEIQIDRQVAGTSISVTAIDARNNESASVFKVVIDVTAPSVPTVHAVTDADEVLEGTAEAGATVVAKVDSQPIGEATADIQGHFVINIAKQTAGTVISVTAKDAAGNESLASTVNVNDATAPVQPIVNQLTDADNMITGVAEIGATVVAKVNGQSIGQASANNSGHFEISITQLVAGTIVSVTSIDSAQNESAATVVTVIDVTKPATPTVNQVTDADTTLSGTAEPGATVVAKVGSQVIGSTTSDLSGHYVMTITKQITGTTITIAATDISGNESDAATVTVNDVTAPAAPVVYPVTDADGVITGATEPGAFVTAKVATVTIASGMANNSGAFSLNISRVPAGTVISVTATDVAHNVSAAKFVTVSDATAPLSPVVTKVTDADTVIKGMAEPGSTVVASTKGNILGTATADSMGSFTINITKQVAGTVIDLTATDASRNASVAAHVTVTDVTAPTAPSVNAVTDADTIIKGTAEAGAKVVAKVNGQTIGEATASATGNFQIGIAKQTAGTKISVTATDAANNASSATEVTVTDATAPSAPVVDEVKDFNRKISGKAEVGSTVTVSVGKTVLGTATANKNGDFAVMIQSAQKAGTVLTVVATDKAGNSSKATTVTVIDKTPPAKPVVDKVTSTSTKVTGIAEANATVYVKVGNKVLGKATANKDGKFTITIAKQKAGTKLTVVAVDKEGNESVAALVTVK